jgi:hypothetical protein
MEARIAELVKLADDAYKRRDFRMEDAYDKKRAELKAQLDKMKPKAQGPVRLLEISDLPRHSWDDKLVKAYGNARCSRCAMQKEYFDRGLRDILSIWTEADKRNDPEGYNKALESYACKPR